MLCCGAVLCCAVFCCVVLCCAELFILYCSCIILYCGVLCSVVLSFLVMSSDCLGLFRQNLLCFAGVDIRGGQILHLTDYGIDMDPAFT
jgi:hypothetical protein